MSIVRNLSKIKNTPKKMQEKECFILWLTLKKGEERP